MPRLGRLADAQESDSVRSPRRYFSLSLSLSLKEIILIRPLIKINNNIQRKGTAAFCSFETNGALH